MTAPGRPTRRAVLVGGALAAAGVLWGCSPEPSRPPGDLRERLAHALRSASSPSAELVQDPQTTLTPVAADWLPGWVIVDVVNSAAPHPRRFYAALSDGGRAEVLTGRPDRFSTLLVDGGVRIDSADLATVVGTVFLDATRDFRAYAYRISSVDDIEWIPRPLPAEQDRRDALIAAYRARITPIRAERGTKSWLVSAWMVQDRDLIEHRLFLRSGRPVTDQAALRERNIPVPYSV